MPLVNLRLTEAQRFFLVQSGLYRELGCNPKLPYMGLVRDDLLLIKTRLNNIPTSRTRDAILRKTEALRMKLDVL